MACFTNRGIQAEAFVAALNQAKIDHIVMKGYVLRGMYPVPELRTFNDIDIVIRKEDRKKSDELMMSLGFDRHTDWEPVYSYARGMEHYEFHTEIMEGKLSDRKSCEDCFRNVWDHAVPAEEHTFHLKPEFHFVYLLSHIAKHIYNAGAGIRMYLDIAVFIRHYGNFVDWEWIRQQLNALELQRFSNTVLTAVERWFGVACPMEYEAIADNTMESFLTFTMEAGVFGHQGRNEAIAKLKNRDEQTPVPKLQQVMQRVFPRASDIQKRYTYLQDNPWLLPVAWVHRMVKNAGLLGRKMQEIQDVLDVDDDELQVMQDLMKEIGL